MTGHSFLNVHYDLNLWSFLEFTLSPPKADESLAVLFPSRWQLCKELDGSVFCSAVALGLICPTLERGDTLKIGKECALGIDRHFHLGDLISVGKWMV